MRNILQNRLYLALYFPRLATDRYATDKQNQAPLALIARTAYGLTIAALDKAAEKQGIFIGQRLADANALCPSLHLLAHAPALDDTCLLHLASNAEHFTPMVALSLPHGLMLDMTGYDRRFGSADIMLKTVIGHYRRLGFEARAAIAPNPAGARALARFGKGGFFPNSALKQAIDALPLQALEQDRTTLTGLWRAGFQTIGALQRIPHQTLGIRFGDLVPIRLDCLYGNRPQTITPLNPEPVCRALTSSKPAPSSAKTPTTHAYSNDISTGQPVMKNELLYFPQRKQIAERPYRIFTPPQPIEMTSKRSNSQPTAFRWRGKLRHIRLSTVPEQKKADWWRHSRSGTMAATRDYYRVEDEAGHRYWIFCNGTAGPQEQTGWFIHGLFA